MIAHSYQNAWIVFMIAGVAMASVSIIAGMKKEKEEETDKKEKPVKEEENSPEE